MEDKTLREIFEKVNAEPFARKLGLRLVKLDYGYSLVEMTFTPEMENILGMAHGGAIFSLIDEAFEAASNSYGESFVALSMNICYLKPPSKGETLYAEAKELSRSDKVGTYEIKVKNDKGDLIASCQAVAHRKGSKSLLSSAN